LVWAIHFALLGQQGGAWLEALAVLRHLTTIWALPKGLRVRYLLASGWILALLLTMMANPLTIPTICIGLASAGSIASGFLLKGVAYRWALLIGESLWLTFGVMSGSLAGILMSLIGAALNLRTIRKLQVSAPELKCQPQRVNHEEVNGGREWAEIKLAVKNLY